MAQVRLVLSFSVDRFPAFPCPLKSVMHFVKPSNRLVRYFFAIVSASGLLHTRRPCAGHYLAFQLYNVRIMPMGLILVSLNTIGKFHSEKLKTFFWHITSFVLETIPYGGSRSPCRNYIFFNYPRHHICFLSLVGFCGWLGQRCLFLAVLESRVMVLAVDTNRAVRLSAF